MSAPRPSRYVREQPVGPAELRLQWHDVRRRVQRQRRIRTAVAAGAVAVVVATVGSAFWPRTNSAWSPGQTVGGVATESSATLREGSRVDIEPNAVAVLESESPVDITVVVQKGRVRFDVAKRPERAFVVKADQVRVRVVGTAFSVSRDHAHVEVAVTRGIVEVQDGELLRRLERGERFVRGAPSEPPAPLGALQPSETAEAPADELAAEEPGVQTEEAAEATAEPGFKRERRPTRIKSTKRGTSPSTAAPAPGSSPLPPAPVTTGTKPPKEAIADPATPTEPTAADVFQAGVRARGAQQWSAAIRAFQTVTERWPQSAYAPMAAFEWGRLAFDVEDDPRQAAAAFRRALELSASPSLTEDALARLTEAYSRFDVAACRRTRAEYLQRFPDGPHFRGAQKACPP